MKNYIFILFTLISFSCFSQTIISWEVLKDVEFEDVWSEEFQAYYMVPKFGKKIGALDGKNIQIRGFVIPVDIVQRLLCAFSKSLQLLFFLWAGRTRICNGNSIVKTIRWIKNGSGDYF
tara:strand:+ start:117 stop:473 length:357 start_codon:yes stop_codon:yes gene_type:complete